MANLAFEIEGWLVLIAGMHKHFGSVAKGFEQVRSSHLDSVLREAINFDKIENVGETGICRKTFEVPECRLGGDVGQEENAAPAAEKKSVIGKRREDGSSVLVIWR